MLQSIINARIGKPRLLLQQSCSTAIALTGLVCCCSTRSCQPGQVCDCSADPTVDPSAAQGAAQPLQSEHIRQLQSLLQKTSRLLKQSNSGTTSAASGTLESAPAGTAESPSGVRTADSMARLQERLLHPMVPAGRIMLMRKLATSTVACCDSARGTRDYAPYWITPAYLGRIHVSALMLRDHLPDVVDKVLIMMARGITGEEVRANGWWAHSE